VEDGKSNNGTWKLSLKRITSNYKGSPSPSSDTGPAITIEV
jgi:hypothetical protein